ncbi:SDR family oxidoreductase [Pseudochelatococcus sp. B33]
MSETRNRIAVVTGSSRGIGRAVAARLASDGMDILLVSRSETKLAEAATAVRSAGTRVEYCAADLAEPSAAERVKQAAMQHFGKVDVLVNSAGATKGGSFLTLSDETWMDGFALKFFGAMRISRALWPLLAASKGNLVNIVGGFARTPDPDFLIGGAVNAALANFTKGLSKQGMRDGVVVNAIHPGTTVTDRLHDIARTRSELEGKTEEEIIASMAEREKIQRLGRPEDVANLVSFLCSPQSRHIQGVSISVDGGATAGLY